MGRSKPSVHQLSHYTLLFPCVLSTNPFFSSIFKITKVSPFFKIMQEEWQNVPFNPPPSPATQQVPWKDTSTLTGPAPLSTFQPPID